MIREPQETVCYRRPDGDPGDPRDPVHGPPCPQSLGDIVKVCVQKIRQEIKIQLTKSGL